MKFRDGFVSNSSSSSFIVDLGNRSMPQLAAEMILSKESYNNGDLTGSGVNFIGQLFLLPAQANVALSIDAKEDGFVFPSCNYDTYILRDGDIAVCNTSNNEPWSSGKTGIVGKRHEGKHDTRFRYDGEDFEIRSERFVDVDATLKLRSKFASCRNSSYTECDFTKGCYDDVLHVEFKDNVYSGQCQSCFLIYQPMKPKIALTAHGADSNHCSLRGRLCTKDTNDECNCTFSLSAEDVARLCQATSFEDLFGRDFSEMQQEMKELVRESSVPRCFLCKEPKDMSNFMDPSARCRLTVEAALCDDCIRGMFDLAVTAALHRL